MQQAPSSLDQVLWLFRCESSSQSQSTPKMASSSSTATPLLYSCIAYKNTILAEHTTSAASATSSLASLILPKIDHSSAQKLTYTHGANHIHYIADAAPASADNAPGLTYLVIAKQDLGRRIPFGYLVEIKKRFLSQQGNTDFSSLPSYGAAAFNSDLKKLMVEYGTTKAGHSDAFKNVQAEIDNVRDIMSKNIEQVLERGERIDLLVDKTDRLGGSAHDFRVRSRGLRRRMWWKNVKLMALLVLVIVFLVYLLVGFGCGLPGMLILSSSYPTSRISNHHHRLVEMHQPLIPSTNSRLVILSLHVFNLAHGLYISYLIPPTSA